MHCNDDHRRDRPLLPAQLQQPQRVGEEAAEGHTDRPHGGERLTSPKAAAKKGARRRTIPVDHDALEADDKDQPGDRAMLPHPGECWDGTVGGHHEQQVTPSKSKPQRSTLTMLWNATGECLLQDLTLHHVEHLR